MIRMMCGLWTPSSIALMVRCVNCQVRTVSLHSCDGDGLVLVMMCMALMSAMLEDGDSRVVGEAMMVTVLVWVQVRQQMLLAMGPLVMNMWCGSG